MLKGSDATPELLGSRLCRARLFQCVLLIINMTMAAYLASYIGSRKLGLQGALPASVILAGVPLILTILANWLGHHFNGHDKRRCVCLFIHFDVLCACCQIGGVAVLATRGLPWKCTGLTSSDVDPGDADYPPDPGYSTIRFGDGESNRGMLDRFCGLPKAYFWLAVILLISYIYTTGLCIRLMVAITQVARKLKAMKAERGTGPLPPNHAQCVIPPTARDAEPAPPPRSYSSAPASGDPTPDPFQEDIEAVVSSVSDDSWTDGRPTPSLSPPPYQADEQKKGVRFQKN